MTVVDVRLVVVAQVAVADATAAHTLRERLQSLLDPFVALMDDAGAEYVGTPVLEARVRAQARGEAQADG